MKEFLLVFRHTPGTTQPSPEQMQASMKLWQDWMGSIAARGQLSSSGSRLAPEGKQVKPGGIVTDGPYVEIKETIGGYIIIKAKDADEAAELSKGCPILNVGGNVEVRELAGMD